jgi:hypothetical protein
MNASSAVTTFTAIDSEGSRTKLFVRLRGVAAALALAMFSAGCATRALWDVKVFSPASGPSLAIAPQNEDVLVRYEEKCSSFRNQSKSLETNQTDLADNAAAAARKSEFETFQPRAFWLFARANGTRHDPPEFVEVTNSCGWTSIPIVNLEMKNGITNRADRVWLRRDERQVRMTKTKSPRSISAGTNAIGQQLYITNAPPEHSYYRMLSASPPRYIAITDAPPDHGYYAVSVRHQFAIWHDGKEAGLYTLPVYSTHGHRTFWRVVLTPLAVTADAVVVGVVVGASVAIIAGPGIAGGMGSPAPAIGAAGHL